MHAAVLSQASGALEIDEVPRPKPGRGEVLLEVASTGVCHTDLHVLKGEVAFPMPCVLGHEVSGVVVEVGDGAQVALGTEVVSSFIMPCGYCRHCVRGHEDLCLTFFAHNRLNGTLYDGKSRLARADGSPLFMYSMGALAQYCVVPDTDVFAVPKGLDLNDAAILGCSAFTAYGAVRNVANLQLGEVVAVVAVGGVGASVIQVARATGAETIIAIDINDDKLLAAKAYGATHTINSLSEDVVTRVAEITGGLGVDVAFEVLGLPQTFETALSILGDGGRAVMVGIAGKEPRASVDITRVVRRKLQILGSYGGRARTDMPKLLRLWERGLINPSDVITRRYPLAEADAAYKALAAGEIVGRAIIDVKDSS